MQEFNVGDRVDIMIGSGELHQDRETADVVETWNSSEGLGLDLDTGHWGYASNAVLVRPATFLPGDRVEAAVGFSGAGGTFEGTVVEPRPEDRPPVTGALVWFRRDEDGDRRWARYENVTFISRPVYAIEEPLADWEKELSSEAPTRALVGPKPEPAEGPVYTAPFEVRDDVLVYDASGAPVVHVLVGEFDFYDRCNFAHFVANALNAAVKESE